MHAAGRGPAWGANFPIDNSWCCSSYLLYSMHRWELAVLPIGLSDCVLMDRWQLMTRTGCTLASMDSGH